MTGLLRGLRNALFLRTRRERVFSLKQRRCNETNQYHPTQQSPHENDWVLSSFILSSGNSRDEIMELVDAARRLWPGVQAHARKEQPGKSFDEATALATEVWEGCCSRWRKPSSVPMGSVRTLKAWMPIFSAFLSPFQSRSEKGSSKTGNTAEFAFKRRLRSSEAGPRFRGTASS